MTNYRGYGIIKDMYSQNENELIAIGERIGKACKPNQVLVLSGDLGAGKTTLTKGLAKGLKIEQMIKSPTYTIVREYEGIMPLYHLDVYRIGDDPDSIDLDDFLYGGGLTVIEWGELLDVSLFDDYLLIRIEKEGDGRRLTVESHGAQSSDLAKEFQNV
ncbi:TPA: tRNA (adenosine(37)-N6)-threonylcarbamoyltransferase complex ATPase subunit type 1 TsaE [Streptococcus suis]|nr:tRNA (adenosine(37)-N6)-threonylcarbamoyltransferase complex ATPase subunit type 1 TsaE [Streptococcus suis]NQO04283.1 tRNA (adenosine(37)-N6)-threonylcarbamoyltransferase complex ATPase subunit type 1 TsaE [Streptococcus suis]NQO30366.1 tRNA (adenosine(37)-N6)-threonylcarbamoyltransferase complex ATPase subunit type 1 TsaE [Streptococcus suis]NQO69174.1 tRNA (adenosine(37)-N6)-threonylcarbamoyltransferase complex ATPase subunit type 1 TsaE [Streptococcus suis]NQO77115.1 tRNA (adenosine(37)-